MTLSVARLLNGEITVTLDTKILTSLLSDLEGYESNAYAAAIEQWEEEVIQTIIYESDTATAWSPEDSRNPGMVKR